ncbi:integrase arm-type DNA-binding domain-containing protein [Methylocystis sp. MJC1]|uniref:tyrosine-type recombinase/integrase n=1 Tax=Methylocystis sp. MJC1 TaxID=2654282 RepID=UPI0013EC98F6|nr:site-specific integrase [Methylocystis sp. MJC1]KAF2990144.1 Prophage CP4-57 integrase [Methylocystis sp. MJC1]MBU6527602.1 integrase arm-type DNA-binding domain-containing protein [Methylocystis sp. MJC1]UZX10542.1 integrase arm-type DNA-binding domain-containing protein [Methylocystis sp. MJC1]
MAAGKLTARAAATSKPGRYGDGAGLYLVVSTSGARKWVFRFTFAGKVTEMGLGAGDAVTLAEARDKAVEARRTLAAGRNPIQERRAAISAATAKPTFGAVADAVIAAKETEWRNAKHRAQWRMTLETYAAPLRSRSVDAIDTEAVLAVLKPIWLEKPETATRLRGRIEAVLDAAKAQGLRTGENPAAWRGHLSHLLPKRTVLSRGHHAAMAYSEVPAFVAQLRERDATAALALEFCILTATRTGETLGARWSEMDMAAKVWTVPAARMKAARAHRIPLPDRAMAILQKLGAARTGEFVFPGQRADKPLSNMAMEMVTRRMKLEGVTVHGFRSAFRDWAGNETSFPREVAEAALSHVIGDKAEQAYRRGDALEKRRALMAAWGSYCEPAAAGNVTAIRRTALGGNER